MKYNLSSDSWTWLKFVYTRYLSIISGGMFMKKISVLFLCLAISIGGEVLAHDNTNYLINSLEGFSMYAQTQSSDEHKHQNLTLLKEAWSINKNTDENIPCISNENIKELLFKGDQAFNKIFKINIDENSYIDISGISYVKIKDSIGKYKSIYEYLNQNYDLKNYYTHQSIETMADYIFTYINGNCYMRYGNAQPRLIVKDSEIVHKKYEGNKLYISLRGRCLESTDISSASAVLIYSDNKWLIDKFDNWGIS